MQHAYRLAALLLLSGAASLTARAQTNYQPGYVLSLSGDTVRGTVDFRQWNQNPTRIDFRPAAGEPKNYGPADIRGFGVAAERYESAVVQVEGSPYKIGELPKSPALLMRRDEAFVRVLVSGPKSLYYYQDRNGKEHFFIRQDGALELLLHKQFIPNEQSNRVVTDRSFADQLQTYLADCPTIGPRLRTVPYTTPGLQKVFGEYYACAGGKAAPTFQQASEKNRASFGVLAGLSQTTVSVTVNDPLLGTSETMRFPSSRRLAGGLFVELPLPRRLRHLSIVPELFYNSYQAQQSYTNTISADRYTTGTVTLHYDYARLNALLRYRHPVGAAASWFAHGGISMGYAVKQVHTRHETVRFYSQETTKDTPAYGSEDKVEQSLIVGAGGSLKRLSAEGRFELGNGFLDGQEQSSHTKRLYLLLGFRF
ncbi:outer membrane beta-barrel protein [Hymenobacter edaphi]|uniref:Uncharacterized protein n=1 Tax=Hymenobacter edaphi TaxID=2211146 RepID=A0A328BMI6_9BACT|nr:outer membrane beta-barrel protein [Hymenobacter edaphi]RAK68187.1 hypothetical protein DLM85_09120 [Hymenobacter edaphi]